MALLSLNKNTSTEKDKDLFEEGSSDIFEIIGPNCGKVSLHKSSSFFVLYLNKSVQIVCEDDWNYYKGNAITKMIQIKTFTFK